MVVARTRTRTGRVGCGLIRGERTGTCHQIFSKGHRHHPAGIRSINENKERAGQLQHLERSSRVKWSDLLFLEDIEY